ncbi:hypothetical protein Tco_0309107 [Tanacetum coccineum]
MITNSKLEIGDEFLKILQDNTSNDMNGGDVTNNIAKVQAKLILLKGLLAACLASTTSSSTEKISDRRNNTAYPMDLAETMIWYMLKKTCVEHKPAMLKP